MSDDESSTCASETLNAENIVPLDASEPWLGLRKILRVNPPEIEIWFDFRKPKYLARTLDTACRLAALISVWCRGGLLLHAAGLFRHFQKKRQSCQINSDFSEEAVIALAPSGGGKSTLTDLASEEFESLSDETVALLPRRDGQWLALGTLFRSSSKARPQISISAHLAAILILEKSLQPALIPASGTEAVRYILGQSYSAFPALGGTPEAFRRAAALVKSTRSFRFLFPKRSREVQALLASVLPSSHRHRTI